MEAFFEASATPPNKQVAYASMLLAENAMVWWMVIKRDHQEPTHWEDFSQQISRQFKIIDEDVKARRTLYKLTQTSSVQNYISEFTRLSFLIPDLEEREKFHQFKEGLKLEIRNEMDK